ncbi:MAG TPA: DUF433 domain-containing protein [Allosphingosinicella sp.]|jgi:uncharacterized protein (DUF433 family)
MGYEEKVGWAAPIVERLPGPPKIVAKPGWCGGEPRIDGTRVPVASILGCWLGGDSAEDIYECYGRVPLGSISLAVDWASEHGIPDTIPYRRVRHAAPGQ